MNISFQLRGCVRIIVSLVAWTWYTQALLLFAEKESTSLTLSTVVQQVLTEHPLSQAAQARIQVALGLTRQAGAYPNPEFTFANNNFVYERTAGLKQVLEWPFKRTYRIDAATADVHVAESEQETIRQDLIATAREAFLRVLLYQEIARVADTFATTTAQLQQSTAQRFQEGDVPAFEVTKANVEALKATKDLEVARGQLTTAQAGLNLLLESVREVQEGLQSLRTIRRIEAR